MAYTQQNLGVGRTGGERNPPTARQMGNVDLALVDHEARVAALEAALVLLTARVVVLETP